MPYGTTDPPLLAHPTRARVLSALAAAGSARRVESLAEELDVHPNTVRVHLDRLEAAGFVRKSRVERPGPGRPHLEWTPVGGTLPIRSAYRALSKWLLQGLLESDVGAADIRDTGRNIGRDMAAGRPPAEAAEALAGLLDSLGFSPSREAGGRFRLQACPYRSAAEQNPVLVCALHHGIVEGFLATVDPQARVSLFEPRPAAEAGCLIGITREPSAGRAAGAAGGSAA